MPNVGSVAGVASSGCAANIGYDLYETISSKIALQKMILFEMILFEIILFEIILILISI